MFIVQSGVKRALDDSKPFKLCLTAGEAKHMRDQLKFALLKNEGWLEVFVFPQPNASDFNVIHTTAPLEWTDAGNVNPPLGSAAR